VTTYAPADSDLFAVAAAEADRDRAYARLDATDYADETKAILRAIVAVASERGEFSANDVRDRLAGARKPRIGRCFALAQELGLVEFVRLTKSTDRGTHGKRIGVYRRRWAG
jgi:hypothetical protein